MSKHLKNSYDLLRRLLAQGLDVTARDPWWWPESGHFSVVVGALLTQQTRYQKVEESLRCLQGHGVASPELLCSLDRQELMEAIKPSGFYRVKAERLQALAQALIDDFGDFSSFQQQVRRDWLLAQRGIGKETADAIICYACHREAMVVDAYTDRLLRGFGFSFRNYDVIQSWLLEEFDICLELLAQRFGEMPPARGCALYHGLIVEYAKRHSRDREVDITSLC